MGFRWLPEWTATVSISSSWKCVYWLTVAEFLTVWYKKCVSKKLRWIRFSLRIYVFSSQYRGSGSSVGIATELRAGRSGIESRWRWDFPSVPTGPGAHPASCKMGTGSLPGVKCGRGVLLTTHPLLVPRSWKSTHRLGHTGPVTGSLCLLPVSIIPLVLYTWPHPNITLIESTSGRNLLYRGDKKNHVFLHFVSSSVTKFSSLFLRYSCSFLRVFKNWYSKAGEFELIALKLMSLLERTSGVPTSRHMKPNSFLWCTVSEDCYSYALVSQNLGKEHN